MVDNLLQATMQPSTVVDCKVAVQQSPDTAFHSVMRAVHAEKKKATGTVAAQ